MQLLNDKLFERIAAFDPRAKTVRPLFVLFELTHIELCVHCIVLYVAQLVGYERAYAKGKALKAMLERFKVIPLLLLLLRFILSRLPSLSISFPIPSFPFFVVVSQCFISFQIQSNPMRCDAMR